MKMDEENTSMWNFFWKIADTVRPLGLKVKKEHIKYSITCWPIATGIEAPYSKTQFNPLSLEIIWIWITTSFIGCTYKGFISGYT